MAKPIKLTIKGTGAAGTDAPTVDDLLGQIRDFVDILTGVEKAVADNGEVALVWRVTNVTMNSPIAFELTPFAVNPAVYIGARAEEVERATYSGLQALRSGIERPAYFTEDVLPKARKMHDRIMNGLADTVVHFDDAISREPLLIDRDAALDVAETVSLSKIAKETAYREIGGIEGFVSKAEQDGYGRAILRFRSRLDGTEIKAVASGAAFRQIEEMRLSEVWHGVRVRVYGEIYYKSLGVVDQLYADSVEVMDRNPLPGIDDIIDPGFTGGLTTEEYLAELRDA